MKNSNPQNIKLGLFVIIGTVLFVLAVYFIGQKQEMFRKTFTVSAYFQNVNGLQKGNNVRYSGINIGTVKSIEMVNDSTIKVDMHIEEGIVTHIKKNAIAAIGSDGLVGSNMIVNIVPGKGIDDVIEDGDIIASYSKIRTDDILNTLNVSSENAAILTSDLIKITDAMIHGKGTLAVLLNDTIMSKELQQSVRNLTIASRNASKTISEVNDIVTSLKTDDNTVLGMLLNDSISGQNLKSIVKNLEASSLEIDNVVKNFNSVIYDFKSGEGAYNYIVNDTTLVNNIKSTLQNVNEGTDKFNQNMEALKHNFFFRGYFRKLEKQKEKEAKRSN